VIEFLSNYGLFLAKTLTVGVAIVLVVAGIVAMTSRGGDKGRGVIRIKRLNHFYESLMDALRDAAFNKYEYKEALKREKLKNKAEAKAEKLARKSPPPSSGGNGNGNGNGDAVDATRSAKKRFFVLQFDGDMRASAVDSLRHEITAVLSVATVQDEVVVQLESPGGVVHGYGLAASQLARVTARGVPLTVVVDKVAASGGYMMAAVADKIVAAPFAIIGSIGVAMEMPNFNRLLKRHNIDFEQITAGEYKRTMSLFGETSSKGRAKLTEEIEETHGIFKAFVKQHRPVVDIAQVATGEHWLGSRALELKLVDVISTSDDYLVEACKTSDVFEVSWEEKSKLSQRIASGFSLTAQALLDRLVQR
jgi:serine protease SohB